MVKPTLPYLDILSEMRTIAPNHPLACYQVRRGLVSFAAGRIGAHHPLAWTLTGLGRVRHDSRGSECWSVRAQGYGVRDGRFILARW